MAMKNMPEIKMGLVAVSRDCFPVELSRRRAAKVAAECGKLGLNIAPCSVVIESETDAMKAVAEMRRKGVDAVTVYLGNFGPEGPTTIFARELGLPFMLVGAAEETGDDLMGSRGDAFCGMLNASLNCGIRNLAPYIREQPIGLPAQVAENVAHFIDVARVVVGVRSLKVFGFGPRPQDFYACQAPIKAMYDLGVEVMENSELDLMIAYKEAAARKKQISAIAKDMARELGEGNEHPEKLKALAQYELALMDFYRKNLGSRKFGVFANKCWPGFEPEFKFVPCYVNSRLFARGIPVACQTDLFGAVSSYMAQLASSHPVTFLDINNTVPDDMNVSDAGSAEKRDLFMGFHCGNTARCLLCEGAAMKHQLIMHRLMEPGKKPNITVGTLDGQLTPSEVTVFRINNSPKGETRAYVAEGRTSSEDPRSFGGIGIIAVPGFGRFYRHVLVEHMFPHHAAIGFKHVGRTLYDAARLLGAKIDAPRPAGVLYPSENPFAV